MDRRASLAMTTGGSRSVCSFGRPKQEARNDETLFIIRRCRPRFSFCHQEIVNSIGSVEFNGFPETTASSWRSGWPGSKFIRYFCPVLLVDALAIACTSTVAGQLIRKLLRSPDCPLWVHRWSAVTVSLKVRSRIVTPNDAALVSA